MANLYVKAVPPADLNRNTEWFTYPGVWTTYILILFFSWILVLSVFGCSPGIAWTIVNLAHFLVSSSFTLSFSFLFFIFKYCFYFLIELNSCLVDLASFCCSCCLIYPLMNDDDLFGNLIVLGFF